LVGQVGEVRGEDGGEQLDHKIFRDWASCDAKL
jgi:hypothetical protein